MSAGSVAVAKWKAKNPEYVKEKAALWRERGGNARAYQRRKLKIEAVRMFVAMVVSGGTLACAHCGKYTGAFGKDAHMDHIDPSTKDFNLSSHNMLARGFDAVMAEAAKCQLLCASCHGIKSAGEKG